MNSAQRVDVYLIHFNGVGDLLKLNTGATSADRFGELQRAFAEQVQPGCKNYAEMIRLDNQHQMCPNGILYTWQLAGPDGGSFRVIRWPTSTDTEIADAKEHLRRTNDVVYMSVLNIRRMIDFAA